MNSKQVDRGDRTALVLAGGGSLGAVQIGMLQALVGRVQIHFVVGPRRAGVAKPDQPEVGGLVPPIDGGLGKAA